MIREGERLSWPGLCLEAKESLIEGAGRGLFSTEAREEGDLLCKYEGTVLRTAEALRLEDKTYLMRLGTQCYVDAREHEDVACRYINDCRNVKGHNVKFIKKPEEECALAVATRRLVRGEELYVDYGKWYWASFKNAKKLSDDKVVEARIERK